MNNATQEIERTTPAQGPAEQLAGGVVSASLPESALEDLPALERLVSAMARMDGGAAGGLFLVQGTRRSPPVDSPVKSSRFT